MSFDPLAPHYRWMEAVSAGPMLQRCRLALLDSVIGAENVLMLGEGIGRFLGRFRRANPSARVMCVDSSRRMLDVAARRVQRGGAGQDGVTFVLADALEWLPGPGGFDLVVSHFFLDCFREDQVAALISGVRMSSRVGARWLISDFREPAGLMGGPARAVLALLYGFFRRATGITARRLPDADRLLEEGGFLLEIRRLFLTGFLATELRRRAD